MSSKKIYVTVGLPADLHARLQSVAKEDYRSMSKMVEIILMNYFKLPWERGKESSDADKP